MSRQAFALTLFAELLTRFGKPGIRQIDGGCVITAIIAIFLDALSRGGLFGLIKDAIVEFFAARPGELEIGKDERFLKLCDLLDEFPVLRFQRSDLGEQFIEI